MRFPPPLVFLGLIGVGVALQHFVRPLAVPIATPALIILGVAIGLPGLVFIAQAIRLFKRTGQDPAPWMPSPELVASGIYRYTRNPMYVGMTLIQLGLGVALNDLWIVAFAFVGLILVHYIAVLPEEAYLAERFGEPYARYKATVRRYL